MTKNIVLVGFMACGKTFTSRDLAKQLGRERVSTDELIEAREGLKISEIFAQSGEPYFRQVEREIVAEVALKNNLIIDCGGGVVTFEENWTALKKNGVSFYLYSTPEAIHRRTKGRTDRPLLNVENPLDKIQELLARRDPHYRKADFVVDSSEDNIGKVVNDILNILKSCSA
ncbi:MAG: shikimate kinase [Candidatus Omnitrophica bacterium]|nr:shikimate kinase [Candidatus Omnitrophota bacterium]